MTQMRACAICGLMHDGRAKACITELMNRRDDLTLKLATVEHQRDRALAEVERCVEIAERDGRDYSELNTKNQDLTAALEKATTELEAILAAQERCGDPNAECPLQDSHKPGSTKDIATECRVLLNGGKCIDDKHRGTECRCCHFLPHCCSHHCCCFKKKAQVQPQ